MLAPIKKNTPRRDGSNNKRRRFPRLTDRRRSRLEPEGAERVFEDIASASRAATERSDSAIPFRAVGG